jgi:hypothetical protein
MIFPSAVNSKHITDSLTFCPTSSRLCLHCSLVLYSFHIWKKKLLMLFYLNQKILGLNLNCSEATFQISRSNSTPE